MDMYDSFSAVDEIVSHRPAAGNVEFVEPARRHLAIIDPCALRRDCLRLSLAQQVRRWRVTDVDTAAEGVRLVREGAGFSVILLGASTCRKIDLTDVARLSAAAPQIPILAVADCENPERARAILRAGARGFLPMSLGLKVLVAALERVRSGGTFVPLVLSDPPEQEAAPEAPGLPEHALTRRQRDVLALIAEGQSNKLIADALRMSESTVKAHVKQIIRRLHVANRTQAALLATRNGRSAETAMRAKVPEEVL